MEFANAQHRMQFKNLCQICRADPTESEWLATLFLLSSPLLANHCSKFVDVSGVDFQGLAGKMQLWSSSEKALVKLAAALYGIPNGTTVNEVFSVLDECNTNLAIEALRIRYQGS